MHCYGMVSMNDISRTTSVLIKYLQQTLLHRACVECILKRQLTSYYIHYHVYFAT